MTFMSRSFAALAALGLSAGLAAAEPAIIFDLGGKFDKSFNESAFRGAQRWAEKTGGEFNEIELSSEAQREQALRRFAQRGANPVVMTGFAFGSVLEEVAPDFPDTKFVIIDAVVDLPNVQSVVFREDQGSFLVGVLAAMASETGTVGFVGGMDIPLIRKFACGYVQGVKHQSPGTEVIQNMTGTTPAAWNDPVKGGELAKAQISQGADVVYAAAGGTGIGVLQAVADAGKLGIGVDSNQNYLHPGNMLTSMVKRVDVAVEKAFTAGAEAEPGIQVLGLANNGVDYAVDENNEDLLTDEMIARVEEVKDAIIADELKVHDYTADSTCPVG